MCGILALFGEEVDVSSHLLSHRGPDDYRSTTLGKCRMDFYRLAINDLTDAGMQPFRDGNEMLICNGEIYNHKEFRKGNEISTSDCEVLLPLIQDCGMMKTLELINGDFAFVYTMLIVISSMLWVFVLSSIRGTHPTLLHLRVKLRHFSPYTPKSKSSPQVICMIRTLTTLYVTIVGTGKCTNMSKLDFIDSFENLSSMPYLNDLKILIVTQGFSSRVVLIVV